MRSILGFLYGINLRKSSSNDHSPGWRRRTKPLADFRNGMDYTVCRPTGCGLMRNTTNTHGRDESISRRLHEINDVNICVSRYYSVSGDRMTCSMLLGVVGIWFAGWLCCLLSHLQRNICLTYWLTDWLLCGERVTLDTTHPGVWLYERALAL